MSGQVEQLQALIPDHHQKKINQKLPVAVNSSSYINISLVYGINPRFTWDSFMVNQIHSISSSVLN
jgi:hypothetical protein